MTYRLILRQESSMAGLRPVRFALDQNRSTWNVPLWQKIHTVRNLSKTKPQTSQEFLNV